MAYKKGRKVETGIWELGDNPGLYLAEVNWKDPETGQRVRERKVIDKVEPLRQWRLARKTDALRGLIKRERSPGHKLPYSTFADEYLVNWSKVTKRPSSYTRDCFSVAHLKGFFGKKVLGNIQRRDVEKYIAQRKVAGLKPGTINREMCCLKNMLRKAVEWGYLEVSPARDVSRQKDQVPEFKFLAFDEAEEFVEHAPVHLRTLFIVALNTGLRRGELFSLEWRDLNFKAGKYGAITVRKTKNYDTRYVSMNRKVHEALATHPRRIVDSKACALVFCNDKGKPFCDIRTGISYACKRAKINHHVRFHDLRHTFASHLVMKGVDLRTVAKLLGHRDIRITMRYAHLAPEHLQAAVEMLDEPAKPTRMAG